MTNRKQVASQPGGRPAALIYCRVSTKEQVSNLSLPTQLKACREYCDRQGFRVLHEFEDAGVSAKTVDRPEFQRLLDYCRRNKSQIRFVVVYNLTRFSRNAHDHAIVRALLYQLGISLRSVNEPISDDSVGKLTENILAAIGQFDNDVKSDRTKAGMRAALERGRWAWRAPIGFLNGNTKAGQPSLVHDPERAALIREAFELTAAGDKHVSEVLRAISARLALAQGAVFNRANVSRPSEESNLLGFPDRSRVRCAARAR
jgi:site-specific DNA recombinase